MSPSPLEELDKEIQRVKTSLEHKNNPPGPSSRSYGMRAGMDMVSGVAVGTLVGYGLDAWLGTLPVFSLICFCLGLAAGVKLMMETSAKAARALEEEENRNA